jgi:hypothetical protein
MLSVKGETGGKQTNNLVGYDMLLTCNTGMLTSTAGAQQLAGLSGHGASSHAGV